MKVPFKKMEIRSQLGHNQYALKWSALIFYEANSGYNAAPTLHNNCYIDKVYLD